MPEYYFFLREGWGLSVQNILDHGDDVSFEIMGETVTIHPRGGPRGTLTIGRSIPQDFGSVDGVVKMLIARFESTSKHNQEEVAEAINNVLNPYY
ncbi:MAG: hypothetical protein KKA55_11345 [Proteobacteria bacterium]|nr:hypothetical protein [Pseudomonadota bacterium]MBU1596112.1 hypothetical protein [Pseudomonadota bacterium]